MSRPLILTVEDDVAIRRGLVDALRFADYDVLETADGREAIEMVKQQPVALLLLDLVLPGTTGYDVLEEVRGFRPSLPVIMITARGREEDRIAGLRSGADDYIVKPFSIREMLARVEAVLRRSPHRAETTERLSGDWGTIDWGRGEFQSVAGESVPLSQRECDLLRYLAQHPDRVVSRDELLQFVWQLDPKGLSTRTIDMHVARLREKIQAVAEGLELVVTVRGRGYKFGWREAEENIT
ncbi:MAG: response regulator transcription factor [Planctomycetales bacterium]|nr:response regulator transcription factor [Planctomycetales bacterium]